LLASSFSIFKSKSVAMVFSSMLSCACPFHRGFVFATARSPVALGSMLQSLLCRQHVGFLALPNL
jgi:hypothetical protein